MAYVKRGKWTAGVERREGGTHYRTYTHSRGAVIETQISRENSLHSKYTVYATVLEKKGEVIASWKSRPFIMSLREAREERTYVVNGLKHLFAHKR